MREPDPMQDPLFDVETPPVKIPSLREEKAASRPRWSKYRPLNPVKCDDCMLVLALAGGKAPASRQAKWRRKAGDSDRLLCYGHASARRAEDGLEPLAGLS